MTSVGMNLVMTVIGFVVSAMFIVFICTRLVCARIQFNASRRSLPIASRSDLSILERGLHGLEPLVVANFPTKKYSDSFLSNSKDAQCAVCLSEYHEEDILRILPYCGHSFHASCIDKWLHQHSTCPVCRISLREFTEKKRLQPMFSSAVRSHYRLESLSTNSCHCLSSSPGLSSRSHNDHEIDLTQQNPFVGESDGVETRQSISVLIEGSRATKSSGNKHVESPSNT
ncbi:hypothetical protein U1Q18_015148 [Sarracenia purpurea var. burkii]